MINSLPTGDHQARINSLEEAARSEAEERGKLQGLLDSAEKRVTDADSSNQTAREALAAEQQAHTATKTQLGSAQKQLDESRTAATDANKALAAEQQAHSTSKAQLGSAQEQLDESRTAATDATKALAAEQQAHSTSKAQLGSAREQLDESRTAATDATKALTTEQNAHTATKTQLESAQEQLEEARTNITNANNALTTEQNAHTATKTQLESAQKQLEEARTNITNANNDLAKQKTDNGVLQGQRDAAQAEATTARADANEQRTNNGVLQGQRDAAQADAAAARADANEQRTNNGVLQGQRDTARDDATAANNLLANESRALNYLRGQYTNLLARVVTLQDERNTASARAQTATNNNAILLTVIQDLQTGVTARTNERDRVVARNQTLNQQLGQLQTQVGNLTTERGRLEVEQDRLQATNRGHGVARIEAARESGELAGQSSSFQQQANIAREEARVAIAAQATSEAQMQETIDRLRSERDYYRGLQEQHETEIERMRANNLSIWQVASDRGVEADRLMDERDHNASNARAAIIYGTSQRTRASTLQDQLNTVTAERDAAINRGTISGNVVAEINTLTLELRNRFPNQAQLQPQPPQQQQSVQQHSAPEEQVVQQQQAPQGQQHAPQGQQHAPQGHQDSNQQGSPSRGDQSRTTPSPTKELKRTHSQRTSTFTSPQGAHQRPRIEDRSLSLMASSSGPQPPVQRDTLPSDNRAATIPQLTPGANPETTNLFDTVPPQFTFRSNAPVETQPQEPATVPPAATQGLIQEVVGSPIPETTPGAEAPLAPDAQAPEQIDDDYTSPNSLDERKQYVIIDVSNPQRIQHSVLNAWIRAKYADSFDAFKTIMNACLSRQTRERTRRPQDAPNPPKCFVQESYRRAGPLNARGRGANRWKWDWPAHDANKACPNVGNTSDPPHQCLKVADANTLWLLNPLREDFDNQERFDRENHIREVAEAAQKATEATQKAEASGAETGGLDTTTDTPSQPPRSERPVDAGFDGTYDTLTSQSHRSSSPGFTTSHRYGDPSATPTRRSRLRTKLNDAGSRLVRSLSHLNITGSSSSVPAPMATSLPDPPKSARGGLSKRSHDAASQDSRRSKISRRPTSNYAVASEYSVASNDGSTRASNTTRPMSVSGSQHTAKSRSSVAHSRNGSTVTATSHLPQLDEAGEESPYKDSNNISYWNGGIEVTRRQHPSDIKSQRQSLGKGKDRHP